MPFLCADSGLSSHQESAWGAAEAMQVIVEVVRKDIIVEHICKCFVSTVLGLREGLRRWSSAEEQLPSFLAVAQQQCTGRGQLNEGFMFGEVRVLLFVLGVCMGGWEWMCQ